MITWQVYMRSDSDRWPWSFTSPCWPCCGSRGSWEESGGGETFLTKGMGLLFTPPIATTSMYRNIKRMRRDQMCFLYKFTFYELQEFDFNDISIYFLRWSWHFRTVTDSTPAILISISLFLFPSMLPHNFKGTRIVNSLNSFVSIIFF